MLEFKHEHVLFLVLTKQFFATPWQLFNMNELRNIPNMCEDPRIIVHRFGHQVPPVNAEIATELTALLHIIKGIPQTNQEDSERIGKSTPLEDELDAFQMAEAHEDGADSMSLFGAPNTPSESAVVIANLLGAGTVIVAVFHWTFHASPTGALDWAHVRERMALLSKGTYANRLEDQDVLDPMVRKQLQSSHTQHTRASDLNRSHAQGLLLTLNLRLAGMLYPDDGRSGPLGRFEIAPTTWREPFLPVDCLFIVLHTSRWPMVAPIICMDG